MSDQLIKAGVNPELSKKGKQKKERARKPKEQLLLVDEPEDHSEEE